MKFAYLIEPPFNYVDSNGRVTGCDVELARVVFSKLDIGEFELVETDFSQLLLGVADGRWRMTTGLFATERRRAFASFSRPIWALPDGFLVRQGNPFYLSGYASAAEAQDARIAVIRDQFQHRSAVHFGVPDDRIEIFEAYMQAAEAVRNGQVDAYASVARAHSGFIAQNPDWNVELVAVPSAEKPPAFGSFGFAQNDFEFRCAVNDVLASYLGSEEHRRMVANFGFSEAEVDLVLGTNS